MKRYFKPPPAEWKNIAARPSDESSKIDKTAREIIDNVRINGDKALRYYSEKFDKTALSDLKVPAEEIYSSSGLISAELKEAISIAQSNIEKFHSAQLFTEPQTETTPGVLCWRKSVAIENVGLYIPGGSAPLFSTVLMLGIPAVIAGCSKIIVCTPPDTGGKANPVILYTCALLGINDIYLAGGAQAIAAMAYGTETIPAVNKIFGPGNRYVTRAKELVMLDGISIDMPAGPSEVLVIADKDASPAFIASDLLSQAEHGADSQVVLLTDYEPLIPKVENEIASQLKDLPRREIAEKALENSIIILMNSIDDCLLFSNIYAPEHLIINTAEPRRITDMVINAGSVFIGKYSCESAGDYASGTNHTLPTNGFAASYSGVSTDTFMKKITFQEISREGIKALGPAIMRMAEAESLMAHKNAVSVRLKE